MRLKTKAQKEILNLKTMKSGVILAHNYQRGEIQDLADYVGDSLDLSRRVVHEPADLIVFCGVNFMAETAAILNPEKTVIIPDIHANCGLVDTLTVDTLKEIKHRHPNAQVVSYINSSAVIKAESDVCCTSANAIEVVKSVESQKVIFVPDRNLATYVAEHVQEKEIIPCEGYCYVHQEINPAKLRYLTQHYPTSCLMVHPECVPLIRELADFVGSTSQMQRYVTTTDHDIYIVGTEDGLAYRLQVDHPQKEFIAIGTTCLGMKQTTIHDVLFALDEEKYLIQVPETIRIQAKRAVDKMLTIQANR